MTCLILTISMITQSGFQWCKQLVMATNTQWCLFLLEIGKIIVSVSEDNITNYVYVETFSFYAKPFTKMYGKWNHVSFHLINTTMNKLVIGKIQNQMYISCEERNRQRWFIGGIWFPTMRDKFKWILRGRDGYLNLFHFADVGSWLKTVWFISSECYIIKKIIFQCFPHNGRPLRRRTSNFNVPVWTRIKI